MSITIGQALYRLGRVRSASEALLKLHPEIAYNRVEFHDGFEMPTHFNTEYVHYFTNYKIPTLPQDIDNIAQVVDQIVPTSDRHVFTSLEYLVRMLETRLDNLISQPPFQIISLGRDCLPRSVPTKWGLKPPRILGETSMPFDLAVHPLRAVADILEDNFATYPLTSSTTFDFNRNHCVDPERGILWNHEVGQEWAENGFEKLVARYAMRVRNFRQALAGNRPTVLVCYENEMFDELARENVRRITRALTSIATCPFIVVCIASAESTPIFSPMEASVVEVLGQTTVVYVRNQIPYPWYMWFEHKHFTLDLGLPFELGVISAVNTAGDMISNRM